MRRWTVLVLLPLFAARSGPAGSVEDIDHYLRLSENVATGAQPTAAELAALKDAGFRTVINLREPQEHDAAAEEAAAEKAGLRYIAIPVSPAHPTEKAVEEFLRVTDDRSIEPVFVHCGTANRVGALWMIRRVLRDGWSLARAEEEAARIGLTTAPLLAFAREYIAARSKPDLN